MSIKVQVIFYSMYGHVYRMAEAVVEGVKQVPGAEVSLYQVPELIPDDILEKYGAKAPRASATWLPKCATSSTKPANCGPRARSLARSQAFLLPPPRNMVARKRPSPVFTA